MFNIGDTVEISDPGKGCPRYVEWVEQNAPCYSSLFIPGEDPNVGSRGIVVAKGIHGRMYGEKMTYLVKTEANEVYVILQDGLTKAQPVVKNSEVLMRVINGEKLRVTMWSDDWYLMYHEELSSEYGQFTLNDGTSVNLAKWLKDKYKWEVFKPKPKFSKGDTVIYDNYSIGVVVGIREPDEIGHIYNVAFNKMSFDYPHVCREKDMEKVNKEMIG